MDLERKMNNIELPIINFKNVFQNETRTLETQKLTDAFTEVGFCLISNVPNYDQNEVLEAIRFFYYGTSPEERFEQLATKGFNRKNDNLVRGLFPLIPGKLSHKEGYDMGPMDHGNESPEEMLERNKNPFIADTPRLVFPDDQDKQSQADQMYKIVDKYTKILTGAADELLSMIAELGNASSDYFAHMFKPYTNSTFRFIMYPHRRKEDIPAGAFLPDGRTISTPAHQDSGFLTLLQTFDYAGLELELDGVWYSVPCPKNTLVVNVGEQLSAMSNHRFKATTHRVLDIDQDRFSNPFFYSPCMDTNINIKIPKSLLWSTENVNGILDDEVYLYGSFLLQKLPIYAEFDYLLKNLPQFVIDKYLTESTKKLPCWATRKGIEVDGKSLCNK